MASKTTKKAQAAHQKSKQSNLPAPKDDGTRWVVIRTAETPAWLKGRQVYPGDGVTREEATRLASGLAEPAKIVQVETA